MQCQSKVQRQVMSRSASVAEPPNSDAACASCRASQPNKQRQEQICSAAVAHTPQDLSICAVSLSKCGGQESKTSPARKGSGVSSKGRSSTERLPQAMLLRGLDRRSARADLAQGHSLKMCCFRAWTGEVVSKVEGLFEQQGANCLRDVNPSHAASGLGQAK
eukprot:1144737-Pelagomonas_calceolata.AAC.2